MNWQLQLYVCWLTMRRQFTHKHTTHTTLIPAFPLTVLPALPTHPTAEPNQPSTTGKNLIMVHPDSTTMDDAFFLLCLFCFYNARAERVTMELTLEKGVSSALNMNTQEHKMLGLLAKRFNQ